MNNNTSKSDKRWQRFQMKSQLLQNPFPLIPLLNVLLLVFLFVVSNSAFVLKPGINIQLPAGSFQQGAFYSSKVVTLTEEGLVFYDDESIPLDSLAGTLRSSAGKNPAMQLSVEADKRVPYDTIMRVLNMANTAGVSNVFLSVRPTFGEEAMP